MLGEFQYDFKFPLPLVAEDEIGVRTQPDPTVVGGEGCLDVGAFNGLPKCQEKLHDATFARRIWTDKQSQRTDVHLTRVLKALEVFDPQFGQHGKFTDPKSGIVPLLANSLSRRPMIAQGDSRLQGATLMDGLCQAVPFDEGQGWGLIAPFAFGVNVRKIQRRRIDMPVIGDEGLRVLFHPRLEFARDGVVSGV